VAKAKGAQARKKLGGSRTGDGTGPREDKVRAVSELQEQFGDSSAVLVSEYRGMTVAELKELRVSLQEVSADYKVYKNTLASIAAKNLGLDDLIALFEGPTAFTFVKGDPVVTAKRLADFAKRVPALVLKGGLLGERILSNRDAEALAKLESREVMLAKVAGMFQSPIQQLANLFAAPLNQLGSMLAQLRDKLPPDGGAPVPAEPAPQPATDGGAAAEAQTEGEAGASEAPATDAEAESAPEASSEAPAEVEADQATETTEG
jgi:large subunit ribosomal protein L10